MIWLVPGLIALIVGIILVSPFFLALLARIGGKSPIAIRLPLRDMARYRARSGSALSAISLGIMIAVIICAVAVARYSNVFDYVGPNMAANTLNVYSPPPAGSPLFSPGQNGPQTETAPTPPSLSAQVATAHAIAAAIGATDVVELDNPSVGLQNPSASGPAVGRPDLRGHSRPSSGLRHQPLVHPVQRRHPQLAARTGGLGRAADLRWRGQGRRRLPRPGRRRQQLQPVHAEPVPRPPRGPRGEPAAHRARRHPTR